MSKNRSVFGHKITRDIYIRLDREWCQHRHDPHEIYCMVGTKTNTHGINNHLFRVQWMRINIYIYMYD